jgi:hypothetical protein
MSAERGDRLISAASIRTAVPLTGTGVQVQIRIVLIDREPELVFGARLPTLDFEDKPLLELPVLTEPVTLPIPTIGIDEFRDSFNLAKTGFQESEEAFDKTVFNTVRRQLQFGTFTSENKAQIRRNLGIDAGSGGDDTGGGGGDSQRSGQFITLPGGLTFGLPALSIADNVLTVDLAEGGIIEVPGLREAEDIADERIGKTLPDAVQSLPQLNTQIEEQIDTATTRGGPVEQLIDTILPSGDIATQEDIPEIQEPDIPDVEGQITEALGGASDLESALFFSEDSLLPLDLNDVDSITDLIRDVALTEFPVSLQNIINGGVEVAFFNKVQLEADGIAPRLIRDTVEVLLESLLSTDTQQRVRERAQEAQ